MRDEIRYQKRMLEELRLLFYTPHHQRSLGRPTEFVLSLGFDALLELAKSMESKGTIPVAPVPAVKIPIVERRPRPPRRQSPSSRSSAPRVSILSNGSSATNNGLPETTTPKQEKPNTRGVYAPPTRSALDEIASPRGRIGLASTWTIVHLPRFTSFLSRSTVKVCQDMSKDKTVSGEQRRRSWRGGRNSI